MYRDRSSCDSSKKCTWKKTKYQTLDTSQCWEEANPYTILLYYIYYIILHNLWNKQTILPSLFFSSQGSVLERSQLGKAGLRQSQVNHLTTTIPILYRFSCWLGTAYGHLINYHYIYIYVCMYIVSFKYVTRSILGKTLYTTTEALEHPLHGHSRTSNDRFLVRRPDSQLEAAKPWHVGRAPAKLEITSMGFQCIQ